MLLVCSVLESQSAVQMFGFAGLPAVVVLVNHVCNSGPQRVTLSAEVLLKSGDKIYVLQK